MTGYGEGEVQSILNFAHYDSCLAAICDVFQQEGKLVGSHASREAGVSAVYLQTLRKFDQDLVADGMSGAVIDDVEPIEIQVDDGQCPPRKIGRGVHQGIKPVVEELAVW